MTKSPTTSTLTLFEVIDTLSRSWWTVVAGVCLGLAGALVALYYIPKEYAAFTQVRITPPKISQEFVRSTVTDDLNQRLLVLRESVFKEDLMDEVLRQHFTLPDDLEQRRSVARLVRSRITVEPAPVEGLFLVTYLDSDAERAASVVNTLMRLCVNENSRSREHTATLLTDTIEEQLAQIKIRLDVKQLELTSFLTQHSVQTKDYLEFNQASAENVKTELAANRQRQSALVRKLEATAARSTGAEVVLDPEDATAVYIDPRVRQLEEAERDLEQLKTRYHDDHPEVRAKVRQVADLEAHLLEAPPTAPGASPRQTPRVKSPLAAQIDSLRAELEELKREERSMVGDIQKFQGRIATTPSTQSRLDQLQEQTTTLKDQYKGLQDQLRKAQSGKELEERQQGEQLEVIEEARTPPQPVSPDVLMVYLIGLAAGLCMFTGPTIGRRLLNPIIGSEARLRALSDVPLLVVIPRVPTEENAGLGRRRTIKNIGLSLLATATLAAVAVYFGPVG